MMDPSDMDVVVWTESQERHAWWCEVLGIAVAASCMAGEEWELPAAGDQSRDAQLRARRRPRRRAVDAA
ncbi:hypothetical protein [Rhodococcus sp. 008]|nr:hypothetical protein [Rhodococcus sp. 008]SCC64085.1 hypothetical protein GA0061093_11753 [Rhodococcus qingshengii]